MKASVEPTPACVRAGSVGIPLSPASGRGAASDLRLTPAAGDRGHDLRRNQAQRLCHRAPSVPRSFSVSDLLESVDNRPLEGANLLSRGPNGTNGPFP